jgi:hypothetical protein
MAASDRFSTRTIESTHSGNPSSTMFDTDTADSGPLGEEVPTEEGGVVALAGWSVLAMTIGIAVIAGAAAILIRRRRHSNRTASAIAQQAMSDLVERSRRESRIVRRRVAKRLSDQIASAA